MEAASLLCKVRSNGEAGRPESGHAEDRLDGGPRAAEDRVPLSVVQLHEGLLHGGDTHTRLIDLAEKMSSHHLVIRWEDENSSSLFDGNLNA